MSTYDAETMINDIKSYLSSNLNTYITDMNTEKGDSLLSTIDSSAYSIVNLRESAMTFNPFVHIAIDDIEAESIGPATHTLYKLIVAVCVTGLDESEDLWKVLLRYSEVLKRIFQEKWDAMTIMRLQI